MLNSQCWRFLSQRSTRHCEVTSLSIPLFYRVKNSRLVITSLLPWWMSKWYSNWTSRKLSCFLSFTHSLSDWSRILSNSYLYGPRRFLRNWFLPIDSGSWYRPLQHVFFKVLSFLKNNTWCNLIHMVAIYSYYRGPFSIHCFRSSEGDGGGDGLRQGKVASRGGEGLTREACRGFPLMHYNKYDNRQLQIYHQLFLSMSWFMYISLKLDY